MGVVFSIDVYGVLVHYFICASFELLVPAQLTHLYGELASRQDRKSCGCREEQANNNDFLDLREAKNPSEDKTYIRLVNSIFFSFRLRRG